MTTIGCKSCGKRVEIGPDHTRCSACGKSFGESSPQSAIDRAHAESRVRIRDTIEPMTTQDVGNMASAFGVDADELREGLSRHGVTLTQAPAAPATVRGELTVVCDSCSQTFDEPHKFCPECGSRTRVPSTDAATDLATRLASVERQLSALQTHSGQVSWQWIRLEEAEKWRVWWGIAWRGLVVYAVLWFVFFVIAASTVQ